MNKKIIREAIYEKRCNLTKEFVKEHSIEIFKNLLKTDILNYNHILVYSDFKNEVKTGDIIKYLLEKNKNIYLPVCNINKLIFHVAKITKLKFDSHINSYGIAEPELSGNIDNVIDCAIVPGIAFDKKGNRIGFGKGYYDKFFDKNKNIFKIALCYELQLVECIPSDPLDYPMDLIVTEDRVIKIQ